MDNLKFNIGDKIMYRRDRWECIAINGKALAVFARIDVKTAVVKNPTMINYKKMFVVVNDPNVIDSNFNYTRINET